MKFIKNFILILLFILPTSNSFGSMVTFVDSFQVSNGLSQTTDRAGLATNTDREVGGVQFSDDGTKMFVRFFRDEDGGANPDTELYSYIDQYNLSTPFDASTGAYAVSCELNHGSVATNGHQPFDLNFSSDGMKLYVANRGVGNNNEDVNFVYRFDLTAPYDISGCSYVQRTENLGNFINGSKAGYSDFGLGNRKNKLQGVSLSNDGKKMFTLMSYGHVLEYDLSTAFDVTTFVLNLNGGIDLSSDTKNPQSIEFNENGTRIFIANHNTHKILQVSLNAPFDTSSYTVDGAVDFNVSSLDSVNQMRAVTFSKNGLIMYIGNDDSGNDIDRVHEYNLVCPFNIIAGKCPPVTENSVRTGIAEAQIMIAKRTIDHSTKSALNRLEWIRRNKDNQNLTNLNIGFDFNNQMLTTLTKAVKTSADNKKIKDKDKDKDKKQEFFFWSEGSIAVGRVGDTNISSFKKIRTEAITLGVDQFTNYDGIQGLAFRIGNNNLDVGTEGSKLDTDTYNLSFYTTTPVKNDTKYVDTVIGFGKLDLDFLTVLDGKRITANRTGRQVYGTFKIKDEIKKNNFILTPSSQLDIGLTMLEAYTESGTGAIIVEDQHINTRKLKTSIAIVQELPNDKYIIKKHGKIEYAADMNSSSNFKYTYVSDKTKSFDERLSSGAVHNVNGEIGIDIVTPDSLSIFLIYERNQALGSGHTDNIIITIGYLPNKKTNYAFKINGSDNLGSEYKISKNINDFEIDFKLNNQDVLKPNTIDEAMVNLKKIF